MEGGSKELRTVGCLRIPIQLDEPKACERLVSHTDAEQRRIVLALSRQMVREHVE